jgi:hypothetical protein
VNGNCTMEMVKSLVAMVTTLSDEVQLLRIDNETLKTQLRDLQRVPTHVPPVRSEAVTCSVGASVISKSYRDVVCAAGGNPDYSFD